MPHLAAFFVVAIVVIVTPGPDTALTIRNTLVGGRRGEIFTGVGVAAGQITWTVLTSVGIAALLVASEPIFRAIKYAGAAYLAFLGFQAIRSAGRPEEDSTVVSRPTRLSAKTAARQGLMNEQREFAERMALDFRLISDTELQLASILGLPAFDAGSRTFYRRVTLIIERSFILKVFDPIAAPEQDALDVLGWLESPAGGFPSTEHKKGSVRR